MKNIILYAIIGVLVLIVGFFVIQNLNKDKDNESMPEEGGEGDGSEEVETGSISGLIEFNGIKPQGDSKGYVYLMYRDHNTGEFKKLDEPTFALEDEGTWQVDDVPTNKVYDVKGVVHYDGTDIKESQMITVSAPSQHEELIFNVTIDDIPDYILEENPVEYGGYIQINGYLPAGATLSMFTKEVSATEFSEVVSKIPVTGNKTTWIWTEAIAGTHYNVKAEAYDSTGVLFAASNVGEKAAPSDNVNFVITSRAQDPNEVPKTSTISGTVKVNGGYSSNSKVHIKARKTSESEYKTVVTVNPSNDKVSWSWNEALTGVEYDVRPYLVEQSKDDISGKSITTVSPASDIKLHIDTYHQPSKPEDKPELVDCNSLGDNKYEASLLYKNIDGAKKYHVIVGKNKNESDVVDSIFNNSGSNDVRVKANVNKGQDYYTNYAYTECSDCSGSNHYSKFSDTLKFKCE